MFALNQTELDFPICLWCSSTYHVASGKLCTQERQFKRSVVSRHNEEKCHYQGLPDGDLRVSGEERAYEKSQHFKIIYVTISPLLLVKNISAYEINTHNVIEKWRKSWMNRDIRDLSFLVLLSIKNDSFHAFPTCLPQKKVLVISLYFPSPTLQE